MLFQRVAKIPIMRLIVKEQTSYQGTRFSFFVKGYLTMRIRSMQRHVLRLIERLIEPRAKKMFVFANRSVALATL